MSKGFGDLFSEKLGKSNAGQVFVKILSILSFLYFFHIISNVVIYDTLIWDEYGLLHERFIFSNFMPKIYWELLWQLKLFSSLTCAYDSKLP